MSSARTRIERGFDAEAVRRWKTTAGRDISVGGQIRLRLELADEHRFRSGVVHLHYAIVG